MLRRRPNSLPKFLRAALRAGLGALSGLDPSTIASYAQNAGFTGDDLMTAVAVALAESGGDPTAYNPEVAARAPAGKGSYGLWQIFLNRHPEFAGQNLYDPQTNADAAFAVYSGAGRSFAPWSTYKSQRYLAFLPAISAPPPITLDAATGQPVEDSADVNQMPSALNLQLPGLPANIAGVPTGSILLLTAVAVGAYLLADSLAD